MQTPDSLTSRERYFRMLEGKPVDRVPCIPILMRYAAAHIGATYGDFTENHRTRVRANQRCAADFGLDQMSTMCDPYCEAQAFGAHVVYLPDTGAHLEAPPLDGEISAARIAALPRPDPATATRMQDRLAAIRLYAAQNGKTFPILGWVEGPAAEAANLRGVGNFFEDLLVEPDLACELMDLCTDVAIVFAKAQIDAGADTIGIGDAVASQVSADVYTRMILPREHRVATAIKQAGAKVRMHICGNITHLLPDLATLGLDVLDVDHMVDMRKVREAVGPKVALAGNINPVAGVLNGTPATIRRHIQETYAAVGNPFLINAGCEVPPGTPMENFRALCHPVPWQP